MLYIQIGVMMMMMMNLLKQWVNKSHGLLCRALVFVHLKNIYIKQSTQSNQINMREWARVVIVCTLINSMVRHLSSYVHKHIHSHAYAHNKSNKKKNNNLNNIHPIHLRLKDFRYKHLTHNKCFRYTWECMWCCYCCVYFFFLCL